MTKGKKKIGIPWSKQTIVCFVGSHNSLQYEHMFHLTEKQFLEAQNELYRDHFVETIDQGMDLENESYTGSWYVGECEKVENEISDRRNFLQDTWYKGINEGIKEPLTNSELLELDRLERFIKKFIA